MEGGLCRFVEWTEVAVELVYKKKTVGFVTMRGIISQATSTLTLKCNAP